MKVCNFTNPRNDVELVAENEQDTFLLGKLAAKIKGAQSYPPSSDHGRSLRFDILDLVRIATDTPR